MEVVKPIIAIGACPRHVETAFGLTALDTASCFYVRAVERAGGIPVILPVTAPGAVRDALRIAQGVLLTGGTDVQPSLYGAPEDPTRTVDPPRDAFEMALFEQTVASDRPLLAVCRGMQLINVAMGGTLLQDVFAATGQNHDDYKRWMDDVHRVDVEPSSRLAKALGVVDLGVNSIHHQGVDRLGAGLRAVAWAEDGSIEGVELPEARFAVGVQWHPEVLDQRREQQGLFEELVIQARQLVGD